MSIASRLQTLWTNISNWLSNPWTTFEKVKKSPITWILFIFFMALPIVTAGVDVAEDIGWVRHKIDPHVEQRLETLEKQVNDLEQKK
jgi:hypothetical protein